MAFCAFRHTFLSVPDHLAGASGRKGNGCGARGAHNGIRILAAERTADGRLNKTNAALRKTDSRGYRLFNVIRAFAGSVYRYAAVFGNGNGCVRLYRGMVYSLSCKSSFKDNIRLFKADGGISALKLVRAGDIRFVVYQNRAGTERLLRIIYSGQRRHLDMSERGKKYRQSHRDNQKLKESAGGAKPPDGGV